MHRFLNLLAVLLIFIPLSSCSQNNNPPKKPADLDTKIGQMLMVGFRGLTVDRTSPIVKNIKQYHIGGVVLFDYDVPSKSPVRNIQSPSQLSKLTSGLQQFSSIPLFVAVDQEGGKVARLKPKYGFPKTVSAEYLGRLNNADTTRAYARSMAETLQKMGINLDLAPVVDVNINPDNPVIGKIGRSFSANPEIVTEQAGLFIKELHKHGILSCLKHFPGHGSSKKDSHLGVVDVSQSWKQSELIPYKKLISNGSVDMIMTAHIFNARLDSAYPATLSKPTVTGLLRDSLGFKGVVLSDDLQMKAIRTQYTLKETIHRSIDAGIDILVFGNNTIFDPDITAKAHRIIKELVQNGAISRQRIDQSYQRIMKLKKRM